MDMKLMIKRLLGRPTCVLAKGARLRRTCRIINAGQRSSQISIGASSIIDGHLMIFAHGGQIRIGEHCFVGEGSRIWSAKSIQIGNRVLISHNVNVFDSLTHPLSARLRHQHFLHISNQGHPKSINLDEQSVCIGDDVWIAAGAIVLKGVKIGEGAIVGAGSIVTHDVEPWTIVGGNPTRVLRRLEPESP